MKNRNVFRRLTALILSLLLAAFCAGGCIGKGKRDSEKSGDEGSAANDTSIIKKTDKEEPSDSAGRISYEEALELLDSYGGADFYLPQPMKDYKKLYFGTVNFCGEPCYSFYPYVEYGDKKVFAGTNCLVSSDSGAVLKKAWTGDYMEAKIKSEDEKPVSERYPDTKITPNEALVVLAEKGNALGLEHDIKEYVFEFKDKLQEAGGLMCYQITPKLEFMKHIELSQSYFVAADGSGTVLFADLTHENEYSRI